MGHSVVFNGDVFFVISVMVSAIASGRTMCAACPVFEMILVLILGIDEAKKSKACWWRVGACSDLATVIGIVICEKSCFAPFSLRDFNSEIMTIPSERLLFLVGSSIFSHTSFPTLSLINSSALSIAHVGSSFNSKFSE